MDSLFKLKELLEKSAMGGSESTGTGRSSNGTEEDEERRREGSSTGASAAAVVMGAAGAAVAAWGVARMISGRSSNGTEEDKKRRREGSSTGASAAAVVMVAHSGVARMISNNANLQGPFKMNTDGACRPRSGGAGGPVPSREQRMMRGPSGYGGILRDRHGRWVRGFYGFIGDTDCLTAEFHGILQGLLLLDKLCYKDSVLETDSDTAEYWINTDSTKYRSDLKDIIKDCRRLKNKNKIEVCSISRDTNKCADKLANIGIDRHKSYTEIIDVPDEIKGIVDREASLLF